MAARTPNHISLSFFTLHRLRDPLIAKHILDLLYEYAEFVPRAFQQGEQWWPIEGKDTDSAIRYWTGSNTVQLRVGGNYKAELTLTTNYSASGGYNTLLFWVELAYFDSPENIERFLDLSTRIYGLVSPVYGSIHQTDDSIAMATVHDPRYGETVVPVDLRKGLPDVYWANYLGPEYVSLIGKENLLTTPCDRIQELSDKGILVVITPSPSAAVGEQIRSTQRTVRKHWGESFFQHWSTA